VVVKAVRRVLAGGGRVALGFTPRSRQPRAGLTETLSAADFEAAGLVGLNDGFCALARKPV